MEPPERKCRIIREFRSLRRKGRKARKKNKVGGSFGNAPSPACSSVFSIKRRERSLFHFHFQEHFGAFGSSKRFVWRNRGRRTDDSAPALGDLPAIRGDKAVSFCGKSMPQFFHFRFFLLLKLISPWQKNHEREK